MSEKKDLGKNEGEEKKEKTSKSNFSDITDKPDYRVAWLSVTGLIGLLLGITIIFFPDFLSKKTYHSIFHEIGYQPREIAKKIIDDEINNLNDSIKRSKDSIDLYQNNKDTTKRLTYWKDINTRFADTLKKLNTYQSYYKDSSLSDTFGFKKLNNAFHFEITPETIYEWDKEYLNTDDSEWSQSVTFYFKHDDIGFSKKSTTDFHIQSYESDIDFLTKYPSAGIWILLVFIFCAFSFMTISNCFHLNNRMVLDDNKIMIDSNKDYYTIVIVTFIILLGLAFIWSKSFYDEEIIKNIFFLRTLDITTKCIMVLGYTTGALCLAGFVYTAAMLTAVIIFTKSKISDLSKKQKEFESNPTNVELNNTISEIKLKLKDKKTSFENLLKYFNTYFILSATILSLMVLFTGALFSTVNSLDFIKLLSDDWGYSPARSDFIYLYGGLHTVILLLVYVPAKMRFSETKILFEAVTSQAPIQQDNSTQNQETEKKWFEFLKDPFSQLKEVLLAASPLLASLIQSLLDMLFK